MKNSSSHASFITCFIIFTLMMAFCNGTATAKMATTAIASKQKKPGEINVTNSRTKPKYKTLYNNDCGNVINCISPYNPGGRNGKGSVEKKLIGSIIEAKDADVHLLSPGMGWVPYWQSKEYPDHFQWWEGWTGLKAGRFGQYVINGGDVIKVLVEQCRKIGVAPFVSFRINDIHHLEDAGKKDIKSQVVSKFYADHPEYLLNPDHFKRKGYYPLRGQDWSIPEVREHKFKFMKEIINNYDLDGFEIDFLRDNNIFNPEKTTQKQRVKIVTDFVKRIRAVMDEKELKTGKRMWFSVRIQNNLKTHSNTGIDVRELYDAGVDIFNLSDFVHTNQQNDLKKIREIVPDAAIYLEMTQATGGHDFIKAERLYGGQTWPKASNEQFYTTANLAYQRGADGVSFFNFAYYRQTVASNPEHVYNPPFEILKQVSDPEWLANKSSQYYWLGKSVYGRQVGVKIESGKSVTLKMDMVLPKNSSENLGRLRVHSKVPFSKELELNVKLNDVELEPCDDTSAFFNNPFDYMLSDDPRRRAWTIPPQAVKSGLNQVKVTVKKGPSFRLEWLDLALNEERTNHPGTVNLDNLLGVVRGSKDIDSPGITELPDGRLLVCYRDKANKKDLKTYIAESTDGGKNWTTIYDFRGNFYGPSFFHHNKAVYMFLRKELAGTKGDLILFKSTDYGRNWEHASLYAA